MQSRKRTRGPLPQQGLQKKQKYAGEVTANTQSIWKCLPRLSEHEMDIDNAIKHSRLFIRLSSEEQKHLRTIITAINDVIDAEKYAFHTHSIELRNFHITDCCVLLAFIMINLNKLRRGMGGTDYCSITKPFYLRCSVYVHRTCQVVQMPTANKKTTFRRQLVRLPAVCAFKQVEFQSADLKDLMQGILQQVSAWRFRPSPTHLHREFASALILQREQVANELAPMPVLTSLIDMGLVASQNSAALEQTQRALEDHAQRLLLHNEQITVAAAEEVKPQATDSKPSRYSGMPTKGANSRYQGVPARASQHGGFQDRKQNPGFLSMRDITEYCIATIKATMEIVATKSAYQITRVYVKCPKSCVDLLYQKLADLRTESSCNIVVLNIQTVHESTSWFDTLNMERHTPIVPPPSTLRVVSIGGIGENCKKALLLLQKFLEESVLAS
ncbi:AaceriABL114Wp [[Ashbya] aceris (nom. inval.)]|nr:AaceriABL114Wp [[Ashbya] aceris (nom. inval.)]